jgi:hypothetical protein
VRVYFAALVSVTIAVSWVAATAPQANGDASGVIAVNVRLENGCNPPRTKPFDAYIQVRNRDTGRRWMLHSGHDGRIRRHFPVGRYRIVPGEPRGRDASYSKAPVYLKLARGEIERVRVVYERGCLVPDG